MTSNKQRLAQWLTYAGTLPFLASTLGEFMHFSLGPIDPKLLAVTYGAIILSFICGIHWGIYLFKSEDCASNLFVTSNIIALFAWVTLFVFPNWYTFPLLAGCFLFLLLLDFRMRSDTVLPEWFYPIRRNATFIVVANLVIIGFI